MTQSDRKPGGTRAAASRREWSTHAERSSLQKPRHVMQEAIRNFAELGTPPLQMQLAREIAADRGAELTLAYRNVVMVSAGLKRSTVDGVEQATRIPCVIFIVRRKWARGHVPAQPEQHLPSHLLTHATAASGRRVCVAVPTDVQLEQPFAAARQHSARGICVKSGNCPDEYGTLTALLRLSGAAEGLFGLTAMHVLTPSYAPAGNMPVAGARTEEAKGLPQPAGVGPIGSSSPIGGQLVPGPDISFDAQLLEVADGPAVHHLLAGMPLSPTEPYVDSPWRYDELTLAPQPPAMHMLLPDNHPLQPDRGMLRVHPAGTSDASLPIPYVDHTGSRIMIHHWLVLHVTSEGGEPMPGDSGAPVVLWLPDGSCTFVGMHIGGSHGVSHLIPAWLLMLPASYTNLPEGTTLELET